MSKAHADALWCRCLEALAYLGLLPVGYRRRTPSEIGRMLAAHGDARVARLVAGYYYPAFYGGADTPLTRAEAERIVAEFEGLVSASAGASASGHKARSEVGPADTLVCSICGRRPAATIQNNDRESAHDH